MFRIVDWSLITPVEWFGWRVGDKRGMQKQAAEMAKANPTKGKQEWLKYVVTEDDLCQSVDAKPAECALWTPQATQPGLRPMVPLGRFEIMLWRGSGKAATVAEFKPKLAALQLGPPEENFTVHNRKIDTLKKGNMGFIRDTQVRHLDKTGTDGPPLDVTYCGVSMFPNGCTDILQIEGLGYRPDLGDRLISEITAIALNTVVRLEPIRG